VWLRAPTWRPAHGEDGATLARSDVAAQSSSATREREEEEARHRKAWLWRREQKLDQGCGVAKAWHCTRCGGDRARGWHRFGSGDLVTGKGGDAASVDCASEAEWACPADRDAGE
jgi:hypothetical protein